MKRIAIIVLLLATIASAQNDELCIRCERWAGGGGGGGTDFGDVPATASGCYTGNGLDNRPIPTGFHPDFLVISEVEQSNNGDITWRSSTMLGDLSCDVECVDATCGCTTNRIMSLSDTGFVLGTNGTVNASGQPYCFFAAQAKAGYMEVGTYIGGAIETDIATSFVPDVVIVGARGNTGNGWIFRTGAFPASTSTSFRRAQAETYLTSYVRSFNEAAPPVTVNPSFTIGVGGANLAAVTYDWVAFNAVNDWIDFGTFSSVATDVETVCDGGILFGMESTNAAVGSHCDTWHVAGATVGITGQTAMGFTTTIPNYSDGSETEGFENFVTNVSTFDIVSTTVGGFCEGDGNRHDWFVVCNGEPPPTDPAPDVTSEFAAVWKFENAAGANALNEAGTTCLTNCDLTDTNSVSRGTFTPTGDQSADFIRTESDRFTCTAATCMNNASTDRLFVPAGGSATWGCWAQNDLDTALEFVWSSGNSGTSDRPQHQIGRSSASDRGFCSVTDAAGTTKTTQNGATNGWVTGDWAHWACVFDNTGNTLQLYKNSVANGTVAAQSDILQTVTGVSSIGASDVAGNFFDGEMYECFFIQQALTAPQLAYVLSCGIDGARCECYEDAPTAFADTGLNSMFGGPSLPDCDTGGF